MNSRRKLVIALGAGALTASLTSFAQQQNKVWRVGYLNQFDTRDPSRPDPLNPFQQGMREFGYVEGKNLVIERRFTEGNNERLTALATELVNLKVDVIIASNTSIVSALQRATTAIPIVMWNVGDPVGAGLVKSLARPGGNVTGLSSLSRTIAAKRLEMLLSIIPKPSRVAYLMDPSHFSNINDLEAVQAEAVKRGVNIQRVEVRAAQDIEKAFALMIKSKMQAFTLAENPVFSQGQLRRHIAELAVKNRLPSISGFSGYAGVGGLMNYGPSFNDQLRRAASYVDKIFKGAKPADLPVEQAAIFELEINGKTAKALGLKIPQSLLIMASKIIE